MAKKTKKATKTKKPTKKELAGIEERITALEREAAELKSEFLGGRLSELRIPEGEQRFVVFSLGPFDGALPLWSVSNIYRMVAIDEAAGSDDILGYIDVHGESIPVIDLRVSLGLESAEPTSDALIVVFTARDSRYAFISASVKGVETVNADDYLAPEKIAREEEYVVGGFKKDGLTIILDPERLVRKGL
ncbi:MAG: hypothetical protein GY771_00395 [bacterium]|nr:hypothetical protein [bacterium]